MVLGRSNIVGKPMAALLLAESCTVTLVHSKSRDIPDILRRADILVAAVGQPEFVRGSWIKEGAVVIDVGINRVTGAEGKSKLVGDVAFAEAQGIAGAITPVPGGVGPMTIACLLRNTRDRRLPPPRPSRTSPSKSHPACEIFPARQPEAGRFQCAKGGACCPGTAAPPAEQNTLKAQAKISPPLQPRGNLLCSARCE